MTKHELLLPSQQPLREKNGAKKIAKLNDSHEAE